MDNATIISNIDAKIASLSLEMAIDALKMAALEYRMDEGAFVALLESI